MTQVATRQLKSCCSHRCSHHLTWRNKNLMSCSARHWPTLTAAPSVTWSPPSWVNPPILPPTSRLTWTFIRLDTANKPCAEFIPGNMKYISATLTHCRWLKDKEDRNIHTTQSIPLLLMGWWCKELGHQHGIELGCQQYFNLSSRWWPSDTIWWHRPESILVQVMTCCLMAPRHYMNQCWPIINADVCISPEGNLTGNGQDIKITHLNLLPYL